MVGNENQGGMQNKDAKDLTEMRINQVFTECLEMLGSIYSGGEVSSTSSAPPSIILVVSLDRPDTL